MSFLGDIFGGIVSGIGAIFGIGKTIVGGVSDALNASGIASLLTVVSSLTSGITDLLGGITTSLGTIIDPIKSVVGSVKTLTDTIENDLIGPIIRPIAQTITSIEGLGHSIEKLVDKGLAGIIEIPKAISDSLGSIEANWDRATKLLAAQQTKLITESLVPGIDKAVAPGLASMTSAFLAFSSPGKLKPDQLFQIHPTPEGADNALSKLVAAASERAEKPVEWYDYLLRALYDTLIFGLQIPAQFEPFIEEARAKANRGFPTRHLGAGEVVALYQRGILNQIDALGELSFSGYNEERGKGLLETVAWLPDASRTLKWLLKGIVSREEATKLFKSIGLNEDDISALIIEALADIDASTLVDWLARGIIDQKTFDDQLRGQGYSDEQIKQVIQGGIRPPSLSVALAAVANRAAGLGGWYSESYLSEPPEDVVNAGKAGRYSETDVQGLWTQHWNAFPISIAVDLFFRGEVNREELKIIVQQNSFPPTMTDLFIKAYSQLISTRSIPSLVERGSLSPGDALLKLKARGFNDQDANLLIDDAVARAAATGPTGQSDLTKLSNAQLTDAYKSGVLDEPTYRTLLKSNGLPDGDVEVIVALAQVDLLAKAKRDEIATLKAEVELGVMTPDEATQQMYTDGFSEPEVIKAATTFKQTKRAAAKIPDLSLLTRMAKKGLLAKEDFLTGVQALGFVAPWDQLIVTLELGSTDANPQQ